MRRNERVDRVGSSLTISINRRILCLGGMRIAPVSHRSIAAPSAVPIAAAHCARCVSVRPRAGPNNALAQCKSHDLEPLPTSLVVAGKRSETGGKEEPGSQSPRIMMVSVGLGK